MQASTVTLTAGSAPEVLKLQRAMPPASLLLPQVDEVERKLMSAVSWALATPAPLQRSWARIVSTVPIDGLGLLTVAVTAQPDGVGAGGGGGGGAGGGGGGGRGTAVAGTGVAAEA